MATIEDGKLSNSDIGSKIKIKIIKGIIPELEGIPIPNYIISEANEIFLKNKLSLRKGHRLPHLLFYCIYNAYKNVNEYKVPKDIARLVNLPQTEIAKASCLFDTNTALFESEDRKKDDFFISFIDLIPNYCKTLGITQPTIEEIQKFGRNLEKDNPELDEKFPQNIAVGIILYFKKRICQ
jgi:transcription initiation factor TFIIIB Brf1 subunit/transcription initiation factor TFIIB